MKRFEILDGLPAYGPMYISITDNDETYYSEGFVVKFYKSNGESWIGNFKPGWTDLIDIHHLGFDNNVLVIAYGTCYIINPEETKAISNFGGDYKTLFKTSDEKIILQDSTSFTIVEDTWFYWHTERISYDGMKNISLNENIISGLAFDPMDSNKEWKEFSYDIDNKVLIGGSYPSEKQNKKPWWKF